MKAVVVTGYGDPDKMEIQEVPMPTPGPNEICIKVSRAGINFADILSRMGLYPGAPKPPFTPGMEVSGTIHVTGKMIKFSRTPMTVGQTPSIGEHTQQILSGLLNYSPQKIQRLEEGGIIRC